MDASLKKYQAQFRFIALGQITTSNAITKGFLPVSNLYSQHFINPKTLDFRTVCFGRRKHYLCFTNTNETLPKSKGI